MSTTTWALDAAHSEIQFKVKHMLVSTVTGHFKTFSATVDTNGDDLTTAKVHVTIDADSISTNNEQRDAHLKSSDFLESSANPQITFDSEKMEKVSGENYKLYGTLSMHGVSKQVVLDVEYGGVVKDPWGNMRSGFSVNGKINRKDWGIVFSMVSETGGIMLGEDVTIHANVEFVQQVAQPA